MRDIKYNWARKRVGSYFLGLFSFVLFPAWLAVVDGGAGFTGRGRGGQHWVTVLF